MPQLLLTISSNIKDDEDVIVKETLTEPLKLTESLEEFRKLVNDAFTKKIHEGLETSCDEDSDSEEDICDSPKKKKK